MKHLLSQYSEKVVRLGIRYFVREWDLIAERTGSGGLPLLPLLQATHMWVMPEAQRAAKVPEVREEADRWFAENPGPVCPPELEAKIDRAVKIAPELMSAYA